MIKMFSASVCIAELAKIITSLIFYFLLCLVVFFNGVCFLKGIFIVFLIILCMCDTDKTIHTIQIIVHSSV